MSSFDPFLILPRNLQRLRGVRVRWMFTSLPIIFVVIVLVCTGEGTLGGSKSFQPLQDIQRALAIGHPLPSTTRFPFLRDFGSWILFLLLALTVVAIQIQWRLFSTCLADLMESGVLTPRAITFSNLQRALRCERMSMSGHEHKFEYIINRLNRILERCRRFSVAWAVVAIGLSALIAESEQSLGLFRVLAHRGMGNQKVNAFSEQAYAHWWASVDHPIGLAVYTILVAIGIYLIGAQNVVGLAAVYIAISVPAFFETSVDWFDRDGAFGWRPLSRIYRSVRWSLGMHGVALSVLLVVVGVSVWHWTLVLFIAWLLVLPIYLGIPWLVFRGVRERAQRKALSSVYASAHNSPMDSVEQFRTAALIVPYIRSATIRPLRRSRVGNYALFAAVVLPTLLAVLEITAQLHFGPGSG